MVGSVDIFRPHVSVINLVLQGRQPRPRVRTFRGIVAVKKGLLRTSGLGFVSLVKYIADRRDLGNFHYQSKPT